MQNYKLKIQTPGKGVKHFSIVLLLAFVISSCVALMLRAENIDITVVPLLCLVLASASYFSGRRSELHNLDLPLSTSDKLALAYFVAGSERAKTILRDYQVANGEITYRAIDSLCAQLESACTQDKLLASGIGQAV